MPPSHFLFLSSCPEPWGGSEELWAAAARKLASAGHTVTACKTMVVREHPRISELTRDGIVVHDYWRISGIQLFHAVGRLVSTGVIKRLRRRQQNARITQTLPTTPPAGAQSWKIKLSALFDAALTSRLQSLKCNYAVISQGENFDGVQFAIACRKIGVPYVLICQKATDFKWPPDAIRDRVRDAFLDVRAVYFVSEHNRALTERQLALPLPHAEVVRNPFLTQVDGALPFPATEGGRVALACVGRLFTMEKGQDTLLEVLSQEKWRSRPVDVHFYGDGIHRVALEQAAKMLDLSNVCFKGFANDVTAVWKTHHALVLPSRCEGLPLVVVEAMLCGRPVIVTNVGGNPEVVDDEATGFIAHGSDSQTFDDAMERAWNRRSEWERMGQVAAQRVRSLVPADPGGDFVMKLTSVFRDARLGGHE